MPPTPPASAPPVTPAIAPLPVPLRRDLLVGGALALLAPLVALREMVLSGLTRVPGNVHDGRLVPLFLEHSWGWLTRHPLHRELWGLPAFYPDGDNALAFSDAMLSFGPFYWPWRALGLPPDTSYQLWLLAVLGTSAAAGYALLRLLWTPPLAAALGAWLAVFSASRLHQISHPQLLPLFFVFAALGAAVSYAREPRRGRRIGAAAGLLASLVAQLYGGFYYGFFLAVALALLLLVALAGAAGRAALLPRLRADLAPWLLLVAAAGAMMIPWLVHYRASAALGGLPDWAAIQQWAPKPLSWLYVSPRALAYRWTRGAEWTAQLGDPFEHAVGLGWLTTGALAVAVVRGRRDPRVRLAAGTTLLLMLATTSLGDGWQPWRWLTAAVPPAAAARVVVRAGLLLPVAAAVCLACWLGRSPARSRKWVALLLLLAGLEQLAALRTHDRDVQRGWVAWLAARVDRDADAFYVVRGGRRPPDVAVLHIDAMWAALAAGVPTVNGFSGVLPAEWRPLRRARLGEARAMRAELDRWLARQGAAGRRVQVVVVPASYRGERREQRDAQRGAPPPVRRRPRR